LIQFDNGKFYECLLSHFNFHLDQTILMTTSHKSITVKYQLQ
jgi:hypothetical protein